MTDHTRPAESLDDAVAAYIAVVDDLYGLYLDSTLGFRTLAQRMGQVQQQGSGQSTDSSTLFMGRGSPNDPASTLQHRTTIGAFKRRNFEGGHNWIRLAQILVVLMYEYWETEYRGRVAAALGLPTATDLKSKLMGDLRLLRHEVIHHQAVLRVRAVTKLEVLHEFQPNQVLSLSDRDMESLVTRVKAEMDEIVRQATGIDPKHRTFGVWSRDV